MILTLTPNTSIDRTLVLPHSQRGETIRSRETTVGMGGKVTDGSWILAELGIPTLIKPSRAELESLAGRRLSSS